VQAETVGDVGKHNSKIFQQGTEWEQHIPAINIGREDDLIKKTQEWSHQTAFHCATRLPPTRSAIKRSGVNKTASNKHALVVRTT
jgi:hypothetical protein